MSRHAHAPRQDVTDIQRERDREHRRHTAGRDFASDGPPVARHLAPPILLLPQPEKTQNGDDDNDCADDIDDAVHEIAFRVD